jgi:hypothetical protein
MIGFFSGLKFRYEYEQAKEPLTAVVFGLSRLFLQLYRLWRALERHDLILYAELR